MKSPNKNAFSLLEILITIAVIGVISSVAIPSYYNYQRGAERSKAVAIVKNLNKAYLLFSNAQWPISSPTNSSSDSATIGWITDSGKTSTNIGDCSLSLRVLRTLQWRTNDEEVSNRGPFMDPRWDPIQATSNDINTFRVVWNSDDRIWLLINKGDPVPTNIVSQRPFSDSSAISAASTNANNGLIINSSGGSNKTTITFDDDFIPVGRF